MRCRTVAVVASAPISFELLRAWWRARRAADIVHVHVPNPWAALLVLLLRTRATVVVSVHGSSTRHGLLRRPHAALTARLLRRAGAILVSAQANAALFELEPYGEKVLIVPYGVDPSRLKARSTGDCEWDERIPTPRQVLFVGRLVYYKGLETLIAASSEFDAQVVLLGDGPLYPQLRRLVDESGLGHRVRFVRDADDATLGDYLRQSTLLVLPSSTISESFGLSMLEAMAVGKPVVVTNIGTGLDEVVRHAGSGRIVPPNDPKALAAAINELLDDSAERERLGANGLRAFAELYTADRMSARVLGIYHQVAEGRGAAHATAR